MYKPRKTNKVVNGANQCWSAEPIIILRIWTYYLHIQVEGIFAMDYCKFLYTDTYINGWTSEHKDIRFYLLFTVVGLFYFS